MGVVRTRDLFNDASKETFVFFHYSTIQIAAPEIKHLINNKSVIDQWPLFASMTKWFSNVNGPGNTKDEMNNEKLMLHATKISDCNSQLISSRDISKLLQYFTILIFLIVKDKCVGLGQWGEFLKN